MTIEDIRPALRTFRVLSLPRPPARPPRTSPASGGTSAGRVGDRRRGAGPLRDVRRPARPASFLATDITERKRADETLRAAYDREHQAADELRRVNEMKNAFLTAVSTSCGPP